MSKPDQTRQPPFFMPAALFQRMLRAVATDQEIAKHIRNPDRRRSEWLRCAIEEKCERSEGNA